MTREFTALTKFYESQTHGSVLEVVVAGPVSLEGANRVAKTINEGIARYQPQCLVINLREFQFPFNAILLGALVDGFQAVRKLGGRRYALVAAGQTLIKLEELLRSTKLESVLGPAYPDVETALVEARVTEAPEPVSVPADLKAAARVPAEPSPPASVHPGIWYPDLEPSSTMVFAEFAGLLMCICLVVIVAAGVWRPLRWLWVIPGGMMVAYYGSEGFRVVRNRVRRARWARSFSGTVTASKANMMLKDDPNRYAQHSRGCGGFDATKLAPATLIEDRQTGALLAVLD